MIRRSHNVHSFTISVERTRKRTSETDTQTRKMLVVDSNVLRSITIPLKVHSRQQHQHLCCMPPTSENYHGANLSLDHPLLEFAAAAAAPPPPSEIAPEQSCSCCCCCQNEPWRKKRRHCGFSRSSSCPAKIMIEHAAAISNDNHRGS